jgi:hypothetical protein
MAFWVQRIETNGNGSLCPFWLEVKGIAKKNPDKAFSLIGVQNSNP